LALKFGKYVINIKKFLFQNFHGRNKEFNLWEVVKVGSNEKHFTTTHVSRFQISFLWVNLLALKFGERVINIKMMLWQKFHVKVPIFELSGGFQSWQY